MIEAEKTDIPVILPLVKSFIEESAWGWHYNRENSIEMLSKYVDSDECAVLLVCHEGELAGWAAIAYDKEFHDEVIGYVSKFYIAPFARKTATARKLTQNCVEWFADNNCAAVFATATAAIEGQGGAFENLMAKYGFKPCGQALVRIENE